MYKHFFTPVVDGALRSGPGYAELLHYFSHSHAVVHLRRSVQVHRTKRLPVLLLSLLLVSPPVRRRQRRTVPSRCRRPLASVRPSPRPSSRRRILLLSLALPCCRCCASALGDGFLGQAAEDSVEHQRLSRAGVAQQKGALALPINHGSPEHLQGQTSTFGLGASSLVKLCGCCSLCFIPRFLRQQDWCFPRGACDLELSVF